MAERTFTYKGKTVVITEDHPRAVISVEDRDFTCHHHHDENGLSMWMCDEAYFASPDVVELARHFVDYGYLFDAPGRVVVDAEGRVVKDPGGDGGHGDGGHDDAGHDNGNHDDAEVER